MKNKVSEKAQNTAYNQLRNENYNDGDLFVVVVGKRSYQFKAVIKNKNYKIAEFIQIVK